MTTNKLNLLRKKVERIDKVIIKLLGKRFIITNQIQNLKREIGIAITQEKREKSLLKKYTTLAKHHKISNSLIQRLFSVIFSYAKKTGIIKR